MRKIFKKQSDGKTLSLSVYDLSDSGYIVTRVLDSENNIVEEKREECESFYECEEYYEVIDEELLEEGYEYVEEDEEELVIEMTPSFLKKEYGCNLPARFLSFLETKEYETYNDQSFDNMPGYEADVSFMVNFTNYALVLYFQDHDYYVENRNFIPLALLDDGEEMRSLAIDINDEKCPVYYYSSSGVEFMLISDSLDAFLKRLY